MLLCVIQGYLILCKQIYESPPLPQTHSQEIANDHWICENYNRKSTQEQMLPDEGKQMRKNPIYFSRNVRFHSENIENLVPRPPDPLPPKPPRWVCADCCQRKTNAAMCALHLPLLVIVVVVVMVKRFHLISASMTCHYKWTSDQWMTSRSVAQKKLQPPRFKSKFHAAVREEWESGRNHHLSMGEAEAPVSIFCLLWKLKSLINDNDNWIQPTTSWSHQSAFCESTLEEEEEVRLGQNLQELTVGFHLLIILTSIILVSRIYTVGTKKRENHSLFQL